MDARTRALKRLPPAYATALRMREEGADAQLIVERLGIEPEALEPLLGIAEAKLAALLRR